VQVGTADGFLGIPHRHQHEHQGVVGHAVGRIGDIPDADADAFRVRHVDVVVADAPRGEILHADPTERTQRRMADPGFVTHADAPVSAGQFGIGRGYGRFRDGRYDAEAGCHLPEQGGLVRLASVNGDSRCR
jgi:hypothetical protein